MKLAAILAAIFAGALAATVLLLVAIARRGAPGPRFVEPLGDEVTIETSDGLNTYRFRGRMVTDPTDDWATDPRTAELATGGGR